MLRCLVVALTLGTATTLGGCSGHEEPPAPSDTHRVQAFPQPPHVSGPVRVELRPALQVVGDRGCRPEPGTGQRCSPDGTAGYRVLGTVRPVVVSEASTAPSADRTSWGTVVRFAPASRDAVRRARDQAAGFGGVVLLTRGDQTLAVIPPPDLTPGRARFLGLERAEAWTLVDAFSGSK